MVRDDDRMLLLRARAGDNDSLEALLNKYKPMVNRIARGYFLNNGDFDDIIQEGMIGLHKAFLSYDINSNATFATFAYLCINRQVQSAVRNSQNSKNIPLKNYLSIDNRGKVVLGEEKESEDSLGMYLESGEPSPEDLMLMRENMAQLNAKIKEKLSELEFAVLTLYLKGYSYKAIANTIHKDTKAISNAIDRIRGKLRFLKKE